MIQRFLIFTLLAAVLCAAEKKPRVAVLAFTAKGVSQMESEAVTELLASAPTLEFDGMSARFAVRW